MPTKFLDNPIGPKGAYSFGGGADVIFAAIGTFESDGVGGVTLVEFAGAGYTINSNGGDDTIHGSNADDFIVTGGGSDTVFGGLGDDTIYGGFEDLVTEDSGKGQNIAVNLLIGDGIAELTAPGAPGDPVFATYMTIPAALSSTDTIVFGDDIIYAGNGADNDMFGDAVTISGSGTITGGADMLYAGTGTDDMWGDWITAGDNTATTGADKFIFEASLFGNLPSALGDTIHDFEVAWDQIVVRNSGLTFALLDTNISGALDVGDLNVSVSGVGISIDLGAATLDLNDTQVIQVLGVFSLSSTDIIFQEDGLIA